MKYTEEQRNIAGDYLLIYHNQCEVLWEHMSRRIEIRLSLDEESVAELLREEDPYDR